MEVEIYSKTNCVYCDRAKMRLSKENPKIHMLDKDYTREDFFKKFKVVNSIVPISIALFANSSVVEKKIVIICHIDQKFGKKLQGVDCLKLF